MSLILPSLPRLLINFVLNSPILENRWSTKFQQLFTICHILPKRKLSYYLFFLHPTIKEEMLNIQNIPMWKSSWFRRDKYELTIKQCQFYLYVSLTPDNIKIAKVIPVYKKDQNYLLVVTDRFQYDPVSRNFLKVLFLTVSRILLMNTTYFLVSNSVPGNAIQPVWQ